MKSGIESFVFLLSDESCASSDSALIQYVRRDRREGNMWTGRDLNSRPPACQAGDLPLIYRPM